MEKSSSFIGHYADEDVEALQARVAELEALGNEVLFLVDGWHGQLTDDLTSAVAPVLNRTPAQSLAAHDRELLLKLADEWSEPCEQSTELNYSHVQEWLRAKADEMEGRQ